MTTGGIRARRLTTVLLAVGLVASACTGSATVTQTGTGNDNAESSIATGDEPTPQPASGSDEPTPAPPSEGASTPVPVSIETPTPVPGGSPVAQLPVEAFRGDTVLGLSGDGSFAYAGLASPWFDATACDAPSQESLAVVDVVVADIGPLMVTAAGLKQAGDVRQLLFGAGGSAAILSSCGPADADPVLWIQRAEFADDGRITSLGTRLDVGAENESNPYLVGWIDDDTIDVRVIIEPDPDESADPVIERRQLSLTTGQILSAERFDFSNDDGFSAQAELTTPQGFVYRVVQDPSGQVGCEGFGVARTLELDTGSQTRLALSQPDLVFSDISNLHTSLTGHVAWSSGCEGYVSAFVGTFLDDGTIADAHLIETYGLPGESFSQFQHYQLTNDGFLNAVGTAFGPNIDVPVPAFLHYDLSTDPHFITTADPRPQIDEQSLFVAVEGTGSWHVGDTLAADPACGARTLYGKTPGGFVRAFPAGTEIDTIVDVDLGETRRVSFPDSDDYVSRSVVVQTECPGSYEGRRVWFGVETDQIIWGLGLQQADMGEVADVLSVRDVVQEGTEYVEATIVQVELLDGTVANIELVGLPFDG